MATTLLTRYILASAWTRLLIFILFYFIVRELHFFDMDFSTVDCMMNVADAKKAETKNMIDTIERLLSEYEQLCKDWQITETSAHIRRNQALYLQFQQRYELQEQIKNLLSSHPLFALRSDPLNKTFNDLQYQYGDIFRTPSNFFKMRNHPEEPLYKALLEKDKSYTLSLSKDGERRAHRIFIYSLIEHASQDFVWENSMEAWKNLKNNNDRSLSLFRTIINAADTEFLNLRARLNRVEEGIFPMLAEAKSSTIKETPEFIDEIINTKINQTETRIISQIESRISTVEEHQKSFITNDFLEQLKSFLLNKQECFQHKNQQALVNLEIKQEASQRGVITTLRDSFDRKLDLANSEILNLKKQNIELQQTVAQQVAESKVQQELIENVRNSFERKMNAKDLLINELREEKTQIIKTVAEMKQLQDKMTHDISIMKDHIDVLRHFHQASMQRASLEMATDNKILLSPSRTFPDLK